MPVESMELYSSSNGDRWLIVHEPRSARIFVKHEPNIASGGNSSLIEIGAFLMQNHGPQHNELLRLIRTLVKQAPAHA